MDWIAQQVVSKDALSVGLYEPQLSWKDQKVIFGIQHQSRNLYAVLEGHRDHTNQFLMLTTHKKGLYSMKSWNMQTHTQTTDS